MRRARHRAGLSQMRLEEWSGVDQTTISRLELGRAPKFAVDRLVFIEAALRGALPLGWCPHDHVCAWQRPKSHESLGRIDWTAELGPSTEQAPERPVTELDWLADR